MDSVMNGRQKLGQIGSDRFVERIRGASNFNRSHAARTYFCWPKKAAPEGAAKERRLNSQMTLQAGTSLSGACSVHVEQAPNPFGRKAHNSERVANAEIE